MLAPFQTPFQTSIPVPWQCEHTFPNKGTTLLPPQRLQGILNIEGPESEPNGSSWSTPEPPQSGQNFHPLPGLR